MSVSTEKIIHLRKLLTDRFGTSNLPEDEGYSTGLDVLDRTGVQRSP
jgi:hypothetical protein